MLTRRSFMVGGVAITAAAYVASTGNSAAQTASAPLAYIIGATAITQVYGDGQRLIAIAVEHDRPVDASMLDPKLYDVEGRTVTRVYAASELQLATTSSDGPFVIIELSPDDAAARLYDTKGAAAKRKPAAASLTITPASSETPAPSAKPSGPPDFGLLPRQVATNTALNLIVDDFVQDIFEDTETGDRLAYNLFVPAIDEEPLPLVLFMHDAGNTSTVVDTTLVQGLGAVSWASPDDQTRHRAIVVAPQYATQVVNDASQATSLLDTTLHLIDTIATEYSVDRNRIYLTGQSGGGMMPIAMMVKQPDTFAAAFLVACQWDPAVVAPLARQKLWVMVSEGDEKAFPGQNAIMKVIEGQGVAYSQALWDGTSSPEQFAALAAAQQAEGRSVNYTVLKQGTVVPAGQEDSPGANHVNTWRIAYTVSGIRDWIMKQSKQG